MFVREVLYKNPSITRPDSGIDDVEWSNSHAKCVLFERHLSRPPEVEGQEPATSLVEKIQRGYITASQQSFTAENAFPADSDFRDILISQSCHDILAILEKRTLHGNAEISTTKATIFNVRRKKVVAAIYVEAKGMCTRLCAHALRCFPRACTCGLSSG